jgi:hypothetical protein
MTERAQGGKRSAFHHFYRSAFREGAIALLEALSK